MKLLTLGLLFLSFVNCDDSRTEMDNQVNNQLPTIGVLLFEGFLANEVVAPMDVFTRADHNGKPFFNVLLVAESNRSYESEEGLAVLPDVTFANCPDLDVLIVPSSMDPNDQIHDEVLIDFIRRQNTHTTYTASHCAGAFLLGEAGIAEGREIVTYCGGSQDLQINYPALLVQDDRIHSVVSDGKFISSNGNLVSYLASLELLEKMTSSKKREEVERALLIHKLK